MKRLEVKIFGQKVYKDPRAFARKALSTSALSSPDPLRDIADLRRTGKTHQGLMLALAKALNKPDERVIVLSNSIMSSDRKIHYAITLLKESFPDDWSKWTFKETSPKYMLRFSNESTITFEHIKTTDHYHKGAYVIDDTYEEANVAMMRGSSRNTCKEFVTTKDIIKKVIK